MPDTSPIRLSKQPSDFRRRSGVVLLQSGSTTCCCCCLHWVGAAIGGGVGFIRGWKRLPPSGTRDRPSRKTILSALLGGIICATLYLVALPIFGNQIMLRWFGIPLAFVPSLALLPVCLFLVFGGYWAKRVRGEVDAASTLEDPLDLACGMVWRGFWFSILGGLIGYLIMFMLPVIF